ncbi:hypothetical protein [Aureibacter tunicatorum]|uniref:ParB/Sulfiredoxin domain-containing protein n=1 Tax=Aureibacter tunicatorum TaxID=866807 RepID=A0AAE4BVA1_9BACT|nr:hypothetical protein [Aureibacter tunicatorum]MDR6241677.1 hypothetical protein [Aureibacter tunicatorum]BDD07337.1 hypothetical protein AUTU_48200 [Aureibacter tunicatorum]
MNKRSKLIPSIALAKNKMLVQDAEIKQNIKIYPELKELIPPLQGEELEQLENNILKEGCREPLLYWHNVSTDEFILIDGHNRYGICKKHHIDFNLKPITLSNFDEAKNWMIDNQLGRRNLSKEQKIYLVGIRYNQEKNTHGGNRKTGEGQNTESVNSAERIGKENNMSPKSVKRAAHFAEGLDNIGESNPELKKQILTGKQKVRLSDIETLSEARDHLKIKNSDQIKIEAEKIKTEKREKLNNKLNSKPTARINETKLKLEVDNLLSTKDERKLKILKNIVNLAQEMIQEYSTDN